MSDKPITIFTADECQALLDLIDKILNSKVDPTQEQVDALAKLKDAAKFYLPTTQDIGSLPIEDRFVERMKGSAKLLDQLFNPGKVREQRDIGFVLLVFPYESKSGRCNYISNGADRKDIINMLREQANRFDTNTQ
jgi:hypothetical protein